MGSGVQKGHFSALTIHSKILFMKKATIKMLCILVFSSISLPLLAQITIDGVSDEPEYKVLATANSNDGFSSTNNIDDLKFYADGNDLYIGIPTDLVDNNNVVIFFNFSGYGGTPAGDVVGEAGTIGVFQQGNFDGSKLDFEVDYAMAVNEGFGTSNLFVDVARYGSSGALFQWDYIGPTSDQVGTSTSLPTSNASFFDAGAVEIAYDSAGTSDAGIEFKIDITEFDGVDNSQTVQLFAAIIAGDGYWSNEILPHSGYTGGNLATDPDLGALSGDFFTSAESLTHTRTLETAAGYRLLSSPTSVSYSTLLDPIWTQGASTGADATNGDPNVFTWDNTSAGDANTNWDGLTDLSGNITSGEGFLAYVYADDDFDGSDDAFPKTLSVSGTPNAVGASPFLNVNPNGWTLLGNPFASTIDFDNLTTSDITGTAYVWDPNAGVSGEWETWNGSTGDLTDGLITPFQGFFVQSVASPLSLEVTFGASSKVTGGTFLGKALNQVQFIRLNVEGENVSNSSFLQFGDGGSLTENVYGDAVELDPLNTKFAKLAFVKSGDLFDIANVGTPEEEVSVPLYFEATEGGNFTITATDFIVPGDMELTFHDYDENVSMLIDGSFSYDFTSFALKARAENPLTLIETGIFEATSVTNNRFGITIRPTSVNNETEDSPLAFALDQNYPNPFNPSTTISYTINEASAVNISVYNLMGQKVATLVDENKTAGQYNVRWNAANVSSGMYYYRLEAGGQAITRKMTLIK